VCTTHVANRPLPPLSFLHMGWIQLVGSLKLQVSFAEFSLFDRALLQKRPVILRSLLIVPTPYLYMSLPYYSAVQHQCKSAGVLQCVAVCCSVLQSLSYNTSARMQAGRLARASSHACPTWEYSARVHVWLASVHLRVTSASARKEGFKRQCCRAGLCH